MRNISCFALNYNLVRMKNKWLMPLVFHWFYSTLNIHAGLGYLSGMSSAVKCLYGKGFFTSSWRFFFGLVELGEQNVHQK